MGCDPSIELFKIHLKVQGTKKICNSLFFKTPLFTYVFFFQDCPIMWPISTILFGSRHKNLCTFSFVLKATL